MKHEIDVPELPEGWRAVAYRCPKKFEHYFDAEEKRLLIAPLDHGSARLIVEKIKPRRIVLEETEEIAIPKNGDWVLRGKVFQQSDGNDFRSSHRIWRVVEEGERSSTTFRERVVNDLKHNKIISEGE